MEEDDFPFYNHVFNIKCNLYFNAYYDHNMLADVPTLLEKTYERLIDNTTFSSLNAVRFSENALEESKFLQKNILIEDDTMKINDELLFDQSNRFSFQAIEAQNTGGVIFLSPAYLRRLAKVKRVKILIHQDNNTNLLWFWLTTFVAKYCSNLMTIKIIHVGLEKLDEDMLVIMAHYLQNHPEITSFLFKGRSQQDFFANDDDSSNSENKENDMEMKNELYNKNHFMLFHSVLAAKNNLVELRLFLILKQFSLIYVSEIIRTNKQLRIVDLTNVIDTSESNVNALDFDSQYFNEVMGENFKDEIFIFFNYLMALEEIQEVGLKNIWFNSEINSIACSVANNLPIKRLSLEKNQSIINSNASLKDNLSFVNSELEKLNLSRVYFSHISKFDNLINCQKVQYLNVGILDFSSFINFLQFIKQTALREVHVALNRNCCQDSLVLLFELIAKNVFEAPNLMFFYSYNLYYFREKKQENIKTFIKPILIKKILPQMENSIKMKIMSFSDPDKGMATTAKKFVYIDEDDYNKVSSSVYALRKVFGNKHEIFKRVAAYTKGTKRLIII